ncbi:trigger factor [Novisyntrophococcus fermenticellae]|uniref:trigger factor n=1 Tax=Novisyntrophococcus fermenticellae TaxID=2068655 RepID=UPI001E460441|nr:trigger factor [Novisyntrophococcus fermenticellae]
MKKKCVLLLLCLSVGAVVFTGCGKKEKNNDSSTSVSSTSESASDSAQTPEDDGIPVVDEEDVMKCIELGEYKGLKLEKTVTSVTDQEVEDTITSNYSNTTITDEPCQKGDTVYIAYVGKLDGKAFDGGSTDGTSITLGSSGYIDGFDDGVIGMKAGETKDLNLTFPDPYEGNKDLSGKAVVFTVTVNNISRPFSELTEDWVKKYTQSASIDEYRSTIKKQLEDQAVTSDESALKQSTWEKVMNDCTVTQYQKSEVDAARKEMENWMTQYAQMMGTDLDGYKQQSGLSEEEFEAQMNAGAKSSAKSKMIMKAIAQNEGIKQDGKDYKDMLAKTAKEFNMTEEELIEQNGQDQVDAYIESELVMKVILDSATITEVPAEAKDAGTDASGSSADSTSK